MDFIHFIQINQQQQFFEAFYYNRHLSIFIRRWYFRKIKRIEAEKKLLLPDNEHGAYLIRDSESRHNDYSLSGMYKSSALFFVLSQ